MAADGISVDFSELNRLAANLSGAPRGAGVFIRKAVEVTARYVRDDWRQAATGMAHAPAFPASITYDVTGRDGLVEAEIGPDKDRRQGALGNLIEYGSIRNPPQGLGHAALQRGEADFEKGLSLALRDAEREAGL